MRPAVPGLNPQAKWRDEDGHLRQKPLGFLRQTLEVYGVCGEVGPRALERGGVNTANRLISPSAWIALVTVSLR